MVLTWETLVTFVGYGLTVGAFVWRMGVFTSKLETVLMALKEEITPMKAHEAKIARLEERVHHLEIAEGKRRR